MDNEKMKLLTRRWVAIPIVAVAVLAALFLVVYGALSGELALATMGGTALFTEAGAIIGFYFGKKASEE